MLRGLSGPAEAQRCAAPLCPIGFTLQLGLSRSQRDQDPTLTLFLFFFFLPFPLALTHTLTSPPTPHPSVPGLLLFHTAAGQKKLIYKSSLLGEEIQAAAELTPRSCSYPGDVSLPVFSPPSEAVWPQTHPGCRGAERSGGNIYNNNTIFFSPFPVFS